MYALPLWNASVCLDKLRMCLRVRMGVEVSATGGVSGMECIWGLVVVSGRRGSSGSSYAMYVWSDFRIISCMSF